MHEKVFRGLESKLEQYVNKQKIFKLVEVLVVDLNAVLADGMG
ncbi:hypothetical protein [Acinetobacter sp.]|nr:hypothetical protein [Acinetobacter sp.]